MIRAALSPFVLLLLSQKKPSNIWNSVLYVIQNIYPPAFGLIILRAFKLFVFVQIRGSAPGVNKAMPSCGAIMEH